MKRHPLPEWLFWVNRLASIPPAQRRPQDVRDLASYSDRLRYALPAVAK